MIYLLHNCSRASSPSSTSWSMDGNGTDRTTTAPHLSILEIAASISSLCCWISIGSGSQMAGEKDHKVGSTNPTRCPVQGSGRSLSPLYHLAFFSAHLSAPVRTSNRDARSCGDLAMPPMLSVSELHGAVPSVGMRPTVALRPYRAARFAGCTMEPSVSVASASGVNPAATPAALPEDEPAGACMWI